MSGTSHRDLRVWQTAMEIATDCYTLSKRLPRDELFGLTSQVRRAAASVPANIAEGYGRYSINESVRYLNIANGSLVEVDTHLELAVRIGYLASTDVEALAAKVKALGAMFSAYKSALRRRQQHPQAPGPRPAVPPTASTTAP